MKTKIERYLRQLAPHMQEREGPQLLREAVKEIDSLQAKIDSLIVTVMFCRGALIEVSPCAYEKCLQPQSEIIGFALQKADEIIGVTLKQESK